MLVLAGPGSGKTFVMIHRVIHLISQLKVDPASILVISFSRASARELKLRFEKQAIDAQKVNFSTFHACFFHIIKTIYHYTSKDIITPKEQGEIMKILLTDPRFEEAYTREKEEEYLSKFSFYKNKGLKSMEEKESENFRALFHAYQKEMHSRHKLDFDDMGLLCLQLFKKQPEVLARWQEKFKFVLIDEFQDINPIQFQIIQLLVKRERNLFVVGDDDQAIYSFRGASPEIMLNFEKIYPDTKKVLLETNFRCSGNIVKKSLEVIGENKLRFFKEITAHNEMKEAVYFKAFESCQEEYRYLADKLEKLLKSGVKPSGIACIYRTNQHMVGLAEYLVRRKLPFVMRESTGSIFKHYIARDILAYLQFFLEGKKRRDFLVIMNKPLRYFSRNACITEEITWKSLREYYRTKPYMDEKITQMEKQEKWVCRLDLYGAVSYIRKAMGYEGYLKEHTAKRQESWEEAVEILEFIHNSTRGVGSLLQWRQEIQDYEEALKQAQEEQKEGIHLMTMHACKGLEYPYVFLPDCNEGKVPHKRAVTDQEVEEERRMFYVAMTRAMERLEILYIQDKLAKKLQPSRFLPIERKTGRMRTGGNKRKEEDYSSSISSSNSQLSRYSSKASSTSSHSSSLSIKSSTGSSLGSSGFSL